MKTLPRVIVALDLSLKEVGRYEFVPSGARAFVALKERDYDDLILRHVDVLASVLQAGELIEADSSLKPLGRQVAGIDVLLAQVGPREIIPPPRPGGGQAAAEP